VAIDGVLRWRGPAAERVGESPCRLFAGNQQALVSRPGGARTTTATHLAHDGTLGVCWVSPDAASTVRTATAAGTQQEYRIDTRAVVQLAANETAFALLTDEGRVCTWGDARGLHALGREPTPDEPADRPAVVPALDGLVVTRIASGGAASAALAESGDVYIWGAAEVDGLGGVPGEVALVDLPRGDVNVVDVAVGAGHVLVLTEDGEVWAAGENANGQLGREDGGVSGWRRWEGPWKGRVKRVYSGPFAWCSLVLVERDDDHGEE